MGVIVQQGYTVTGGGGWEEVAWTQPTTDQATIVFTGLSAYKFVHMQYAVVFTSAATTITLSCRVSGGTWRTIGTISKATTSGLSFIGHVEIAGFNQSNDAKVVSVFGAGSTNTLDASDAANAMINVEVYINGFMPSWNEVWDELRIAPASSSFEFSTADQRGYVYVYGQS